MEEHESNDDNCRILLPQLMEATLAAYQLQQESTIMTSSAAAAAAATAAAASATNDYVRSRGVLPTTTSRSKNYSITGLEPHNALRLPLGSSIDNAIELESDEDHMDEDEAVAVDMRRRKQQQHRTDCYGIAGDYYQPETEAFRDLMMTRVPSIANVDYQTIRDVILPGWASARAAGKVMSTSSHRQKTVDPGMSGATAFLKKPKEKGKMKSPSSSNRSTPSFRKVAKKKADETRIRALEQAKIYVAMAAAAEGGVETSHLRRHRRVEEFGSSSQAANFVGVPENMILEACKLGGKELNGFKVWQETVPLSATESSLTRNGTGSKILATAETRAPPRTKKRSADSAELVDAAAAAPPSTPKRKETSIKNKAVKKRATIKLNSKQGDGDGTSTEDQGKVEKVTFDLTKLLPLSIANTPAFSMDSRYIELVCRVTGDVIVKFKGVAAAAEALGVNKKLVLQSKFNDRGGHGRRKQGDANVMPWPTHYLRFSKRDDPVDCYVYGTQTQDLFAVHESHNDRLRRWYSAPTKPSSLHHTANTKIIIQNNNRNVPPPTDHSPERGTPMELDVVTTTTATAPSPSNATVYNGTATTAQPHQQESLLSSSSPQQQQQQQQQQPLDYGFGLCIVCQQQISKVLFDPCRHCVLCPSCSDQACPKFCPYCRTKITKRVQPENPVEFLRPRIFSAKQFFFPQS